MFYKLLKMTVRPLLKLFFWVKVIGKENANYEGKIIIASNHKNYYDPIWVHLLVKPKVYFMAKSELFKNKFFAWVIRSLGAFPVERGKGDLSAFKNAFDLLSQGKTMAIFPEGTRVKGDALKRFQPGVAMIALRAHARVLPVYIDRPIRFLRRANIYIGEFIDFDQVIGKDMGDTDRIKAATQYLYDVISDLKAKAEKR